MTAKRNRKKPPPSNSTNLFQSIASAITSPQVSKEPVLKRLVYLLGHLSLTQLVNWENCDVSWGIKFSFEDVCNLSHVLFTELDKSFETSCLTEESVELATLLLRCCLKVMPLLVPKQEIVLEKAKTLVKILDRLIRAKNKDDRPLDPRFLCTCLEVFIDEILLSKLVRDLLFLVDSAFSSSRVFSNHDTARVVELVAAHLVFSMSDEKLRKMYVEGLDWKQVHAGRAPQISLHAAASLLSNPVMFSAPRMIHACVVLLVSDAIGISSPQQCVKGLDIQLIDRYIDAFEKSVVLFTWHMCKGENASSRKFGVSTSSSQDLLLPSTLEKVNHLTLKLKDSWASYQSSNVKRTHDDLVAYTVVYAKVSLYVFDSFCSETMLSQTLSILACVILRASSDDVMDSVLEKYNACSIEDLYLLSSTLKLMSCSMLQAIRALRNLHPSEDVRACKEYKAVMDVVQRFEQFSVGLPSQRFLCDRMESHPHRNVKSKWMLMHFSGLLSVSFALKLDFLVKDSIFGMVVSLYLFILEGGDLEALEGSVCHSEEQLSSVPSSGSKDSAASGETNEAEETAIGRKRSGAIALKFQKSRTLYMGKVSEATDEEKGSDSGVGVEEERSNGESFLWCVTEKRSDVDDLADFIVCEPGRDYSDWLKGRGRYRNQRWKTDKIAIQRWNKKKKAWRENKRKIV